MAEPKARPIPPELKTLLECSVCSKTEDLVVLTCLHKVCRNCLTKVGPSSSEGTGSQTRTLECPSCETPTRIPNLGVELVPGDSFSAIIRHHVRTTASKKPSAAKQPSPCWLHADDVLTLFCQTCEIPCCQTCVDDKDGLHHGHQTCKVSDMHSRLDRDCRDAIESLEGISATMTNQKRTLKDNEKAMEAELENLQDAATKISSSMFVLAATKTQLTEKVEEITKVAKDKHSAGKEELRTYLAEVDAVKLYAIVLRELGTAADKVNHLPGVNHQLDRLSVPPQYYFWRSPNIPHFKQPNANYFNADAIALSNLILKETEVPVPISYLAQSFYLEETSKFDLQGSVLGLAVLFNHIVVVRSRYDVVYIYGIAGKVRKRITVPNLKDPRSLSVVDAKEGRLVVADCMGQCLHWLEVNEEFDVILHVVQHLPCAPAGVCADSLGRAFVTGNEVLICKLSGEYGKVVQSIKVADKWWPKVPIRIGHSCFAVRDGASSYHIFYFDDKGNHILYEQPALNSPRYMVPFSDKFVLAADRGDERFVVMGPFPEKLTHTGSVTVSADKYESIYEALLTHNVLKIKSFSYDITCLHVDCENSVIYICQEMGRQVMIRMVKYRPGYKTTYITFGLDEEHMGMMNDGMLQAVTNSSTKKKRGGLMKLFHRSVKV